MYYLELLRDSEGTLSRWSRLHLLLLARTCPHWARVVGFTPFFLCVIHKVGLCPSSGDINSLMMKVHRRRLSVTHLFVYENETYNYNTYQDQEYNFPTYIHTTHIRTYFLSIEKNMDQENFPTYIPLTLYPRRGSRGISDIPPRHPRFTKII
jgi:hypothetical protein